MVEFAKHMGLAPIVEEKLETEKQKTQRKAFLFKQVQKICKWVFSYDPEQISKAVDSAADNFQERLIYQAKELKKIKAAEDPWCILRQKDSPIHLGQVDASNPARHTAHRQRKRDANKSNVTNPITPTTNTSVEATQFNTDALNQSMQQSGQETVPPRNLSTAATGAIRGGIPSSIKNRLLIMDKNKLLQT